MHKVVASVLAGSDCRPVRALRAPLVVVPGTSRDSCEVVPGTSRDSCEVALGRPGQTAEIRARGSVQACCRL